MPQVAQTELESALILHHMQLTVPSVPVSTMMSMHACVVRVTVELLENLQSFAGFVTFVGIEDE